jgi:hypothetical protein
MLDDFKSEVIVRCVDIEWIADIHCLSFVLKKLYKFVCIYLLLNTGIVEYAVDKLNHLSDL